MSSGAALTKDDFLGQIWTICTTLTEEAMAVALSKVTELGFDPNRGVVPLQEAFINLASARGILEDAIEKQKLVQLPITVQKEVLSDLQAISRSLQGLSAGTDEVANLVNSIEALNTAIWKYGLHNLSDEVLGYQKKLNQIKNQEVQVSSAITELRIAQKAAESTISTSTQVEQARADAAALLEQIRQNSAAAGTLLEQIADAGTKSSVLFSTIQQQEKQSGELTSSIKTANNELLALDGSIRKFYGQVEEYRNKINQTGEDAAGLMRTSEAGFKKLTEDSNARIDSAVESLRTSEASVTEELRAKIGANAAEAQSELAKLTADTRAAIAAQQAVSETELKAALDQVGASTSRLFDDTQTKIQTLETELSRRSSETIEANQKKTEQLVDDLAKLKDQIGEQIAQATGFTLFGAFQARQNEISGSKSIWVYAIGVLVLVSAGVTIWIAHEAEFYTAHSFAFWIKLSLTVPLAFAITFCTVQYGRERRLEEEYAFKSSISVSLNPYRDMIKSILKDSPEDQTKYADFVIDSVRNVFTPPTDKVFEADHAPGLTTKTFEQAAEIIGTVVKAGK